MKRITALLVFILFAPLSAHGQGAVLTPGQVYDDTNSAFVYVGNWSTATSSAYHGGTYQRTYTGGDYVEFQTDGDAIALYTSFGTSRSAAEVCIDGMCGALMLNANISYYGPVLIMIGPGTHTIRITKSGDNTSYYLPFDAVEVFDLNGTAAAASTLSTFQIAGGQTAGLDYVVTAGDVWAGIMQFAQLIMLALLLMVSLFTRR